MSTTPNYNRLAVVALYYAEQLEASTIGANLNRTLEAARHFVHGLDPISGSNTREGLDQLLGDLARSARDVRQPPYVTQIALSAARKWMGVLAGDLVRGGVAKEDGPLMPRVSDERPATRPVPRDADEERTG